MYYTIVKNAKIKSHVLVYFHFFDSSGAVGLFVTSSVSLLGNSVNYFILWWLVEAPCMGILPYECTCIFFLA